MCSESEEMTELSGLSVGDVVFLKSDKERKTPMTISHFSYGDDGETQLAHVNWLTSFKDLKFDAISVQTIVRS